MKIIITENQLNKIMESEGKSHVVEEIMNMAGIEVSLGYGSRQKIGTDKYTDCVYFWFSYPHTEKQSFKRLWFLTMRNKVIGVDQYPNFTTITDGFNYIPEDILNSYFKEKGKEYLNDYLSKKYPSSKL